MKADPLNELEGHARMLLTQAKVLRELKAAHPKAFKKLEKGLSPLLAELRSLVSRLYGLEAALKSSLGEDNSAQTLRREFL